MQPVSTAPSPWLHRYANGFHAWKREEQGDSVLFKRPIGLVEGFFDSDGVHFGGRADFHTILNVEIRSSETTLSLRRRILLAWTNLRVQHVLLGSSVRIDTDNGLRSFHVHVPRTVESAIDEASRNVMFLEDDYPGVEFDAFYKHVMSTGRTITESKGVSRLFVLPLRQTSTQTFELTLIQIAGHLVLDGMTSYSWSSHFVHLLNQSETELLAQIETFTKAEKVRTVLPPAQEDLYPVVPGNVARQRWFWAVMRVLRHTKRPMPSGFANPVCRRVQHSPSLPMPAKYPKAFDYSPHNQPPLETGSIAFKIPHAAAQRLILLSRSAGASIGAGCFALTGMAMMALETKLHPLVPLPERKPFTASFPLNPRPFFGYDGPADSCMLAFSEGVVLPWLPVDLDVEGRFKILCRRAHEGLKSYQKGLRDQVEGLDSHSPLRLLANGYLGAIERSGIDVQGAYAARSLAGAATCGVSSVGSVRAFLHQGMYPLEKNTNKDFVVDFRAVRHGVRARENEFLVACAGHGDGTLHFGASYDATAMDDAMVRLWREMMQSILEPEQQPKL